jgi:uncharacterized protein YgiM (DUF1202 family)
MLRLLITLCCSLFLVMLIGGRDYGQLRPGLVAAQGASVAPAATTSPPPVSLARETAALPPAPEVRRVAFTRPLPDDRLPLTLPLVRADITPPEVAVVASPLVDTQDGQEVRHIRARSVNVREGPSTRTEVIGQLAKGEAVLVLWTEDDGWAHVLIEGDGIAGYVRADLLTP